MKGQETERDWLPASPVLTSTHLRASEHFYLIERHRITGHADVCTLFYIFSPESYATITFVLLFGGGEKTSIILFVGIYCVLYNIKVHLEINFKCQGWRFPTFSRCFRLILMRNLILCCMIVGGFLLISEVI